MNQTLVLDHNFRFNYENKGLVIRGRIVSVFLPQFLV